MRTAEQVPAAIEEEVTLGLLHWFADGFRLKESENLFYAPTTTKAVQAARQKMAAAGKPLSFPLTYLRLTGVNRETTGYNPRSLLRRGIYVVTDSKDDSFVRKLHLARVDMEYEVTFLVEDHREMMKFVSAWMTLGQENRVNFSLNYYGVDIDIPCRLSPQLTVPEKETSVDEQLNIYEITGSIIVEGYMTNQHADSDSDVALVKTLSTAVEPVASVSELKPGPMLNAALANIRR